MSMTNFRVHLEQRLTSKEYDLVELPPRRLMDDCDDSLNKLSDYERHQASCERNSPNWRR
jgi:hypothetical protein